MNQLALIADDRHVRDPHDFYPTLTGYVRAALSLLPVGYTPETILDPGAGTGVWGQVARERWPHAWIEGVEVRSTPHPDAYDVWFIGDLARYTHPPMIDLVIGNPPYKLAEQFVRRSLDLLLPSGYLVFLLRLGFLEGQDRNFTAEEKAELVKKGKRFKSMETGLLRAHPPQAVGVYVQRPSFIGGGTDMTAYAAFVWQKGWSGTTTLHWLITE
jgi:hypothetical protein